MRPNVELGFASLEKETSDVVLPMEGSIPPWLSGSLIRNGAAKFEVGKENYNHWFDGLAMLHRFAFGDGEVRYTNRLLRGQSYLYAKEKNRIAYPEFATNPKLSLPLRIYLNATGKYTDNASVNVAKIASSYIALTETPPRVQFDPHSLETSGRFRYNDGVRGHLTTVHPHYKNHAVINYITHFSLPSTYKIYRISQGTKRKVFASVPTRQPAYMHSFGVTENYVILTEFPLYINFIRLLTRGGPFADNLSWKPERGTKFLVISKGDGSLVGSWTTEPLFAFHHINCFERDGAVVVDIVAYKDSSIIKSLYLQNLRSEKFLLPIPRLLRFSLDFGRDKTSPQLISGEVFAEFPRINYCRCNGTDYRYVYGLSDHHSRGFPSKIVKTDVQKGTYTDWHRENCYPGEPVFVPQPGNHDEDGGVVMSMVLDTEVKRSFLIILDARTLTEVARATLPFPVPFGSHGQYFQ